MLVGVDASRITRPNRTGTENYTLHVLRALLRRDESTNDYRLYFSTPPSPGLLPDRANLDTRVIRLPRLWTQVGLSREMLLLPPDVLFIPTHVLPLVHPRRTVVVVYDVGHRFFPRAHRVAEWLYLEWAIRRHVRLASELLTISESSKQDLVRLYGADPNRLHVAYPAVDERFPPLDVPAVEAARAKYGLPRRYVLHLGTVKPRKNLARLIQAFARARLSDDVGLVLAGQMGAGAQMLRQIASQAGVGDRLRLVSYVADADLPALYSGATAVALVSLYEGFGIPALEALACGAPLVVSWHGSLPEVAGGAAVQVNPLDVDAIARGLKQVVKDQALADSLRRQGPERAHAFTWSAAADVTRMAIERAGRR
jgi:glycosyltransferase involved in cell wall biosynthesis